MNHESFVERARQLSGLDDALEVERAIEAVLETLGERLSEPGARALSTELPATMRDWPLRRRVPGTFGRTELFDRVQRRCGRSPGFAVELAQSVCCALREHVSEATCRRVRMMLPPDIAELLSFHDGPRPIERGPRLEPIGSGRTLASGRPGSQHPLSEAAPPGAQDDSVARAAEPHADTKLSSSRGLTQERLDESLATAKPGSRRTVLDR